MAKNKWFEVDKEGLAKILERKGKSFIVFEVFQNGWDEPITKLIGVLEMIPNRSLAKFEVEDNSPNGFADLSHAFTLFAESAKKGDPTKRGRFNLGEKLVLAACEEAEIETTTGTIKFLPDGTRQKLRRKREAGSVFRALVRMTREEFEQVCEEVHDLIPPRGIRTVFNGEVLTAPQPVRTISEALPTEISDGNGGLKRTIRKTKINIYRVPEGKKGFIYEMGIPVVETGDTFSVDIMQKVPLNMDRDNVTEGFRRKLRTIILNATYDLLDEHTVQATWVKEALSDEDCSNAAIERSLDIRFGLNRVAFDPSDHEANKRAMDNGYTVVPGRALGKNEWDKAKASGAIQAAGQVFPTGMETSPHGQKAIHWNHLTCEQKLMILFTERLARELMDFYVEVKIYNLADKAAAFYGGRRLGYNLMRLGKRWFSNFPKNMQDVLDLIIHELAHENAKDHLSDAYHRETTRIGAKMVILAISSPELFDAGNIDVETEGRKYAAVC
jgi:hypothetical protein